MQRVHIFQRQCACFIAVCLLTMAACVSAPPEPQSQPAPPIVAAEPASEPAPPLVKFDPASVSVELKQTTFVDIRALVDNLNSIIQAKNYDAWSQELTDAYRGHYSSPEVLAQMSDYPVLKRQGIVLHTLEDYFIYVVYPSRQHDRVDDIEFIEAMRVRAITVTAKGERLVLYNLEKIGDTWKIAIWR